MNSPRHSAHSATALLDWPQQVPAAVAQCLADADMVHAMELGPPEWWQAWQRQRLGELLAWLAQNAAWRHWLEPVSTADALHMLPVMRRQHFRAMIENTSPRVPASFGELGQSQTSGSSGVPITFWFSGLARRLNNNIYWADNQRQGRDMRAETAVISTAPPPHTDSHIEMPGDPWLSPGRQLARYSLNFSVEEHAHWLCNHAPAYFTTFPALLSGMLSVIEIKGLKAPRIDQVMTFAETVEPELRERTKRILGARIVDRYSCDELGPLAFQCPQSDAHYHVAVTNAIVEVTDDDGRVLPYGEAGTVLVTGLHQWASPALRYELGDVGTLLPHCPACGVTVPVLTRLLGRKRALIHRADGQLVYVRVQAGDWLNCAPVREWRMVQTAPLDFSVQVVLERPLTHEERAASLAMLARRLGDEFRFELEQVPAIAWPPGRKRQEIVGLSAHEVRP